MGTLLAIVRLLIFTLIALTVTLLLTFGSLFGMAQRYSFGIFTAGVRLIRYFLGINVTYSGTVPTDQGLIMCNHRSYIDVVLIPSRVPYVVVAKKQVRSWPVVGWAGMALKVIFVDRDSPESRKHTRATIKSRLDEGLSVLIFPEGTTARGPEVLPFKPGMFAVAAESGFTITPVALEYARQDMAWVGTDTFLPHFMRTFRHRSVRVAVSFGAPVSDSDSAALNQKTHSWVAQEVMRLRKGWDGE